MLDNMWVIVLLGCATWRVSYMLLYERGPFDLFLEIRDSMGIKHYDDGTPFEYPESFLGSLFSCTYCLSVWVAGGWCLLALISEAAAMWVSLPFSLSAIAVLIDTTIEKD